MYVYLYSYETRNKEEQVQVSKHLINSYPCLPRIPGRFAPPLCGWLNVITIEFTTYIRRKWRLCFTHTLP